MVGLRTPLKKKKKKQQRSTAAITGSRAGLCQSIVSVCTEYSKKAGLEHRVQCKVTSPPSSHIISPSHDFKPPLRTYDMCDGREPKDNWLYVQSTLYRMNFIRIGLQRRGAVRVDPITRDRQLCEQDTVRAGNLASRRRRGYQEYAR